ncbi:MAG: DUF1667 domain-containing protein [Candidatus Omnitrophota bacterium]
MEKKLICIECPEGCELKVDIEDVRVLKVQGNQCPKGEKYAISEIQNPLRILTSTVCAKGLSLKLVPVRTDNPIPKNRIMDAMRKIRKTSINKPINVGDVLIENFLDLGVNLIATRSVREES